MQRVEQRVVVKVQVEGPARGQHRSAYHSFDEVFQKKVCSPTLLVIPILVNLALALPVPVYLVSTSIKVYHNSVAPLLYGSMVVRRLDVP